MEDGFTVNLLIPSCVHLFAEEDGRDGVDAEVHHARINTVIFTQQQGHTEAASASLKTGNEITVRHATETAFDQECTSTAFHDKVISKSLF